MSVGAWFSPQEQEAWRSPWRNARAFSHLHRGAKYIAFAREFGTALTMSFLTPAQRHFQHAQLHKKTLFFSKTTLPSAVNPD
jgi:hypothetical protein